MMDLRSAARLLDGQVSGRQVSCPGPGHSRRDRSLAVRLSATAPDGFVVASHANDDWRACRDHVRSRLGIERVSVSAARARPPSPIARAAIETAKRADAQDRAHRIRSAERLWSQAVNPRGTVVEAYLRGRGIDLPDDVAGRALRFHGACPWRADDGSITRVLAMVAAMRDLRTDELVAVHRTALTAAGEKIGRRMLGPCGDTAIKLDVAGTALTVGEGIESCLAARQVGFGPVWAMGTAGAIERLPVLPDVGTLSFLEERDRASARAVMHCAARWHRGGRKVVRVLPRFGKDMNDALRAAS